MCVLFIDRKYCTPHRSVGIYYLLDKCVHALIDDIYIDTA